MAWGNEDAVESFSVLGLDKLARALNVKPPVGRVGIIGDDKPHYAEGQKQPTRASTNAEIGAVHEFGAPARGIPPRSFLRVPIASNLQKEMEKSELFDHHTLSEVLRTGSVKPWMEKVVICAEACVQDAFDTGGNGNWPAWKNPKYSNNTGQLLVDTQQLRNSITSEVK